MRLSVGRCEGLRRQIANVQQRRGFPPLGKFTYDGLSEVGKRSERDVETICAIKAGSAPPVTGWKVPPRNTDSLVEQRVRAY